jgi:hypothetical protein
MLAIELNIYDRDNVLSPTVGYTSPCSKTLDSWQLVCSVTVRLKPEHHLLKITKEKKR